MKVKQPSIAKGKLRHISGVVLLLIGCNQELMANSWGRKYTTGTCWQGECSREMQAEAGEWKRTWKGTDTDGSKEAKR